MTKRIRNGTTNPAAWKQFQRQVARFLKRSGSATIKPWTRDELYDR
jgi:hypothetical protein